MNAILFRYCRVFLESGCPDPSNNVNALLVFPPTPVISSQGRVRNARGPYDADIRSGVKGDGNGLALFVETKYNVCRLKHITTVVVVRRWTGIDHPSVENRGHNVSKGNVDL
jgi:hypothetical protein